MLIDRVVKQARKYFPDLQIKFKDESILMKIIGKLLFFNRTFMIDYTTTVGSTIYFSSKKSLEDLKYSAFITLLHELVHIWDSKQNKLFKFLYLFPQILAPFILLLLFFFSWKLVLPLSLFFILPIPAYFRMRYERRAYLISLYVLNKMIGSGDLFNEYKELSKKNFKGLGYYCMWYIPGFDKSFEEMVIKIKNGEKPLEGEIMEIIDDLIYHIFHITHSNK